MKCWSASFWAANLAVCVSALGCSSTTDTGSRGGAVEFGTLQQALSSSSYQVFSTLVSEAPNQLTFSAEIVNTSSSAVSGVELYYYVDESAHAPLSAVVDWASLPTSVSKLNLGGNKQALVFRVNQAIAAHASLTLQIRLHTRDWTLANFADDFSYQGLTKTRSENVNVGLYQAGKLVYGTSKDADLSVAQPSANLDQLEIRAQILQQFSNQLTLKLSIKNTGANNVSNVKARYFLNPSGQSSSTVATIDWASCAASTQVNTPKPDLQELVFDLGGTSLVPTQVCEIYARIHTADWSALNFTDDYSFAGLSTMEKVNPNIPGYIGDKQVFGHGVSDAHWRVIGTAKDFPGLDRTSWAPVPLGVSPNGTRYVYYVNASGNPVVSVKGATWNTLPTAGLENFGEHARFAFIGETPVLYSMAEVRKLSGAAWTLIATPSALSSVELSNIAVTPSGAVYAAPREPNRVQLQLATGVSSWTAVGAPILPSMPSALPTSLASSPNGKLYMVWGEYAQDSGNIFVSRFDGASWVKLSNQAVRHSNFGGGARYLSITKDERVFFELTIGGLRSSFFQAYTVSNGALVNFSNWGIGPHSEPCQHPISVYADAAGNVYRSSNFTDAGVRNYYLEKFDFASNTWKLLAPTLHNSVFWKSESTDCVQSIDTSQAQDISIRVSDGTVTTYVK